MHISKIELENIKSHQSSIFEFSRGTTAITGENGAGKTSIIEAVAWALFDLLEYKKDDFVRRGAKKGSVKITFESGLDEREYIVYRDTGSGYHVTDPRLQTRVADKKEEVFRFLWQHLGLEPGTDLKSLFRQAIGVPQGTFTAIFLDGATERKVAFDRLLKVEEYRQAAEKLRETSRFIDQSVAAVRENIARAEGELLHSPKIESEYEALKLHTTQLSAEIKTVAGDLTKKQSLVNLLDAEEHRLSDLKTKIERSRSNHEKTAIVVTQAKNQVELARQAAEKISQTSANHELHSAALKRLAKLDGERRRRDEIRAELAKIDAEIVNVTAERKQADQSLKNIAAAKREIESLKSKATDQLRIEKEIDDLRNRIAAARTADERILSIEAELERLRIKYKKNKTELTEAEVKSVLNTKLDELETQHADLVTTLAKLRANLERDEKFESEISGGLCPILSARCLNIDDGVALDEYLSNRSRDFRTQIAELESNYFKLTEELKAARESRQFQTALKNYRNRDSEIELEGAELNAKKKQLSEQRQKLNVLERQMSEAALELKSLADPSAQIRVLEGQLIKEKQLNIDLDNLNRRLNRLEDDRKLQADRLNEFKSFDDKWNLFSKQRDATAGDHRIFIANEAEAAAFDTRKLELEKIEAQIQTASSEIEKSEKAFAAARGDYDAEKHMIERAELLTSERRLAECKATFEAEKRREAQLGSELENLGKVRENLTRQFQEKERLETVAQATAFIRDTLKEAAPRVARNYVYHISLEANQMFREITGNAERTLRWAEDYSIVLEDEGFERPFQSLSGGEQMAAALSVRLALLKQLTDIRIAFFDEPTTNMDAERRENLAMQISRITHFDQLFVISHDETFDSYVDNVLAI